MLPLWPSPECMIVTVTAPVEIPREFTICHIRLELYPSFWRTYSTVAVQTWPLSQLICKQPRFHWHVTLLDFLPHFRRTKLVRMIRLAVMNVLVANVPNILYLWGVNRSRKIPSKFPALKCMQEKPRKFTDETLQGGQGLSSLID